jgi:hypothetical protein
LLGNFSNPKVGEDIDETTNIGNKNSMIIKLNDISYTELFLPIEVKASSGNVTFNIIRGFNTKDYPDDNGSIA